VREAGFRLQIRKVYVAESATLQIRKKHEAGLEIERAFAHNKVTYMSAKMFGGSPLARAFLNVLGGTDRQSPLTLSMSTGEPIHGTASIRLHDNESIACRR
jgi:hypothetical protein